MSTETKSISLDEVFERAGGRGPLSRALGVTFQAIAQWHRVPVARVLEVEKITGIPREDLRPDVYPRERAA